MNKRIFLIVVALIVLLLLAAPGYCLYPSNADPDQVKALVQIQREKDKQNREVSRAKEEQAKQAREQKEGSDPAKNAAKDKTRDIKRLPQTSGDAVKSEAFKRLEPPRRIQPGKQVVAQDKPGQTQTALAPRRPNWILFLVMLAVIIAGVWGYKKKQGS